MYQDLKGEVQAQAPTIQKQSETIENLCEEIGRLQEQVKFLNEEVQRKNMILEKRIQLISTKRQKTIDGWISRKEEGLSECEEFCITWATCVVI